MRSWTAPVFVYEASCIDLTGGYTTIVCGQAPLHTHKYTSNEQYNVTYRERIEIPDEEWTHSGFPRSSWECKSHVSSRRAVAPLPRGLELSDRKNCHIQPLRSHGTRTCKCVEDCVRGAAWLPLPSIKKLASLVICYSTTGSRGTTLATLLNVSTS